MPGRRSPVHAANVTRGITNATPGPVATSLSGSADASSVGNKGVQIAVHDNAGNSTTVSCPYRVKYDFLGFPLPKSKSPVSVL